MPLSSSFLFKGLSESQLQRLNSAAKEIQMPEGGWLFQEGKNADRIYILKSGAAPWHMMAARQLYDLGGRWSRLSVLQSGSPKISLPPMVRSPSGVTSAGASSVSLDVFFRVIWKTVAGSAESLAFSGIKGEKAFISTRTGDFLSP